MDSKSADDLVYGLQFGLNIRLPLEATFREEQLGHLLASGKVVRPFCHIRLPILHFDVFDIHLLYSDVLTKIKSYLHVPGDFIEHILVQTREPYRLCLEPVTKNLEYLSTHSNLLGAIQEVCYFFIVNTLIKLLQGLTFLDTVYNIWNEKQWKNSLFDLEMIKWIKLLLGAVDVTTDKTLSYLKEFNAQLSHPVCVRYHKEIVDQVGVW